MARDACAVERLQAQVDDLRQQVIAYRLIAEQAVGALARHQEELWRVQSEQSWRVDGVRVALADTTHRLLALMAAGRPGPGEGSPVEVSGRASHPGQIAPTSPPTSDQAEVAS